MFHRKPLLKKPTLIKNGTLVTLDKERRTFKGDLLVENGVISKVQKSIRSKKDYSIVDATDQFVIPGLIQTHVHLCQTLFKGMADDMLLLDWLKDRIWPLENAHNKKSIQTSALWSVLELNLTGTTSILDMATVHHTNELLEAVKSTGIRYWGGKCLMDKKDSAGPLYEPTTSALKETEELIKEWDKNSDLIKYALCPRFVISCTDELLEACSDLSKFRNLILHTHASENLEEIELVRKRTGMENIDFLEHLGLLNDRAAIAHCIHLNKNELQLMKKRNAGILHCPSSNLKLGSGIARIEEYKNLGLKLSLGADGAPCNNRLDMFMEMRHAALLQKPISGPTAMKAQDTLEIATLGGADVLGMKDHLGSLEVGKLADIVLVDRTSPNLIGIEDPYSALVYSASGNDVSNVMIAGKWIVKNKRHKTIDVDYLLKTIPRERKNILARAEI